MRLRIVAGVVVGLVVAALLSAPLVRGCGGLCSDQLLDGQPPHTYCAVAASCGNHALVAWPVTLLLGVFAGLLAVSAVWRLQHRARARP
ncbi:MAG: hypothetical protein JF887_00315 [Candidatus Dormibacteraeota bacterium]|uniref:Uncharacterized protein n=1 Tax=Candidatus Amunia macphersoniae TaxID=3127014 RepID=A0A934KJJ2_9BACT|nr:hypothetical protein [Candidatus Dormibacteraeota bacterium]